MLPVTIVIPTFGRDEVLTNTVQHLLNLAVPAAEILIVDQTATHTPEAQECLSHWNKTGSIRWIQLSRPSITKAMNCGLREARCALVLFLDDDIIPTSQLVESHATAHQKCPDLWATVGQVIQPWQQPEPLLAPRRLTRLRADFDFPFHSTIDQPVLNVMAGNLCVRRDKALKIGGFDENFVGAAYRFETDFARRVNAAGGPIRFLGTAGINHLRIASGGTRSTGSHLTSVDPKHGIGDYYFAFLHGGKLESWRYASIRVVREVTTKFHAAHPWWIPVKLIGELRAMWGGWRMARKMVAVSSRQSPEKSGVSIIGPKSMADSNSTESAGTP